ncbi:unnamed protein product [Phaedon cochleariae]|uniref:C-type lectin domain-containing protein n=1 Tax=Phaedon cochleariae TaxID=80249 RepID=A0A9P0DJH4_PHACE|nr:unnamed protein product [Phaedon cochleariae]
MIGVTRIICVLAMMSISTGVAVYRREAFQRLSVGWGNPDLPTIEAKNRQYYVETVLRADYFKAQYYCKRHGMELVSIESKEENDALKKALDGLELSGNYQFLTSGVKIPDVEIWAWMSSGKPIRYRNFKNGYNKYGTGNRCISAIYDEPSKGLNMMWTSDPCDEYKFFICEEKNQCNRTNEYTTASYMRG